MPQLAAAETRTLLEQVSWETFLELAEGRRGSVPRMTFDRPNVATHCRPTSRSPR